MTTGQNGYEKLSPNGDPERLPSLKAGEVWIACHNCHTRDDNKVYHTADQCRYLLNLNDVRPVPRDSLTDEWSLCERCLLERLPDRDSDEVWIASNPSSKGATVYHVDTKCRLLRKLKHVRTVSREAMRGSLDLDRCHVCEDGYYKSKKQTGTQLASVLRREDVTPDNYKQAVREWRREKSDAEDGG